MSGSTKNPAPTQAANGTRPVFPLPLVGRTEELAALESLMEKHEDRLSAVLVSGGGGVGKSRVVAELASGAERRGWSVAQGRAYPVEHGVPYALFSDAFLPLLRGLDPETLSVLSRGGEAELRYLFPALGQSRERLPIADGEPDEIRTRLLWNFAEFLKNYAARAPLLVVLEDLQWADHSSLELIHFVARQAPGHPLFIVCTYNDAERDHSPQLAQLSRSLESMGVARAMRLGPLSREQVAETVSRAFAVDAGLVGEFTAMLDGWTRGNPFFVEEILKSLVAGGRLTSHKGTWVGWDAKDLVLPVSIREAVTTHLRRLTENAQTVADLTAVIGARTDYALLASISRLPGPALLSALDELCTHGILTEQADGNSVVYAYLHPVVRETIYRAFGLQRARMLHGTVAEAMEAFWGSKVMDHADELAYHFARSDADALSEKAVLYLTAAGRRANERHANREAADYLRAALDRMPEGYRAADGTNAQTLRQELAHALMRLGDYESARAMWSEVLAVAPEDRAEEAGMRRAMGLVTFWCGRHEEALEHFDAGLAAAEAAGNTAEGVHIRLVRGHCLQELGRSEEALAVLTAALPDAEAVGSPELLARAHRALSLLHVWIGPPDVAEKHGRRAIELASATGDLTVEFWTRWGLAVLAGMTGDTKRMAEGVAAATDIADRLRSPVLRLWTADMSIEMAYATGDWDAGLALGEQAIALARSLNQAPLLARVLAWTSAIHVGRGEFDRAKTLLDEASAMAGIDHPKGLGDVHMAVPTYTGLAYYLSGIGDHEGAIRAARRGLEITEGTGYRLWAVYRLLPALAEACLWAEHIDEAEAVGKRMRSMAEALSHKLGIAWADACDALVCWKHGDPAGSIELMRKAAEALEEIPMIPYAVRVRRQLAARLAETGDIDGAMAELRGVHRVLSRLGAEPELEMARAQFRQWNQRPPPRPIAEGVAGLTGRELEIARLVARRKSNKAIGKELGISPRTVSTHLSNIFQKLEVGSRTELGDMIRDQGLMEG
ncbi:MAG: AAA family ATPase [Gemmatimonadetes bacterium]|nr:AAA family ATPase [Gemmatimonadota bacterium]